VLAAGLAMTMTPMTAAVMASVPPQNAGVASAATNTSRELGGVFGIALLGAVVTASFTRNFFAQLVSKGFPPNIAHRIVGTAGSQAAAGGGTAEAFTKAGISPDQAQAIIDSVHQSFVHAIHVGMFIAIGFMVLASVVSFVFVRSHVEKREGGPIEAFAG
jgi:hypothetical protein